MSGVLGKMCGAVICGSVLLALAVGLGTSAAKKKAERAKPEVADRPMNAQDLQIVDCLLPGQLRRLGGQQTYLSRRRPIRTTALDCQIRGGEYVAYDRANYETALRVWLETAEAGDPQAQYYVGEIYERGLGREPDHAKAAEWYRKAADKGHAQAQINLGFLYEQGLGVPRDAGQALDLYRKATGVSGVIMLDSEVAAIQQELSAVNARLAAAEQETETLDRELVSTRAELAAERSAGRQAAAGTVQLERRLAQLEQKLKTDQQQVAQLRESRQRYSIAGPTIEIIDTTAVRSAAPARPETNREIVGRVEAPAGLASLSIDGERQSVEEGGFFRFRPRSRRVTLLAKDLQGKQRELVHDLDAKARAEGSSRQDPAKFGSYHALIIGNSDYVSLPRVETAQRDVTALAELLRNRYGFQVTLLENATYLDVLSAFSTLRKKLVEKDNLVVYYAGHGELDSATGLGYWLPIDADKVRKTNWISSREISLQLSQLPPKHVLVIADSCYSGALTRSSLARFDNPAGKERDKWMLDMSAKRSRSALTSGGLEPVLDAGAGGHSIFARSVLDTLAQGSDPLETYRLWATVKARVMLETRSLRHEQVPEYAPIQYAGHEGGEFFFVPVRG